MKRHIQSFLLLTFLIFLLIPTITMAMEQDIQIKIDGNTVITDAPPLLVAGRVLIPVRIISETLGFSVDWHANTREIFLQKNDLNLKFNINEPFIWNNGNKALLDVVPVIKDGRVFLPIRAFSENIGALVDWDGQDRIVYVATKVQKNSTSPIEPYKLDSLQQEETSLVLTISGEQRWEPVFLTLSKPDRLVIDLNNTILGEDLVGIEVNENEFISAVRYSQYEINPNKVRIVVDLKQKVDYSYQLVENSLTINFAPKTYKVVIDPGHGGSDPGATSYSGYQEKEFNLAIALRVNELLKDEQSIAVHLTRDADFFVSLDDRVDFANSLEADLFISIHGNAMPNNSKISGIETYYTRTSSYSFAQVIHKKLVSLTGLPDRGIRTANFRVIKNTNMPAVLLEAGYLSNKGDLAKMSTAGYQEQVALSVVESIKKYFK